MSFPQVLEVAIGLVLVYYIMGSVVSIVTQAVMEAVQTRGKSLEKYLRIVAGDKYMDLTSLPQIKALRPVRYVNMLSVFSGNTEPKRVEKIPVSVMVDAFFDLAGIVDKEIPAEELLNLVNQLPESDGKHAMSTWILQGVNKVEDLQKRATAYFSGIMDQSSSTFKANARSFVVIFSLFITLLFGTDSIQLVKDLWTNAGLRAIAQAQAQMLVQEEGSHAELTTLIDDLSALTIRIGWWRTQPLPASNNPMDWIQFILLKGLGLGITVVAVSQGSSFWYDLLKRLTGQSSPSRPTSDDVKG